MSVSSGFTVQANNITLASHACEGGSPFTRVETSRLDLIQRFTIPRTTCDAKSIKEYWWRGHRERVFLNRACLMNYGSLMKRVQWVFHRFFFSETTSGSMIRSDGELSHGRHPLPKKDSHVHVSSVHSFKTLYAV